MARVDLDHDACYRALATRDARFDGRLFTGVKTTGIYCRPICPARTPKRANVSFYASAAAAQEAGFRPCLRCRPEAAPDLAVWLGTANTVTRALSLIEHGALDTSDVAALAERVGVGERQLRRLFARHLGASPIAVAQTRRVLLAKQLLHDSQLTMSELSLAAGFTSIRRFNEEFLRLFGRPPSALRRATSGAARAREGRVTLLLRYRPPYDWPAMLAFLRLRALPGVELVEGESYARTLDIAGAHGVVRVEPAAGHALRVTVSVARLSALPEILARVRRVFDLGADPHAIGQHLAEDPRLARLVAARPGLRVPGAWDTFELAVRAVLGQQISVTAAVGLAGALVARYGARLAHAEGELAGLTHVFPTAEQLARMDPATLRMPRTRALALHSLAEAAAQDPQLFGARRELADAVAELRRLAGIGEWTAQYIAMRALREPDAFPASDLGLLRAMQGADGERPTVRALLAHAERWRPWRAYAAQHLWLADSERAATPARARPHAEPPPLRSPASLRRTPDAAQPVAARGGSVR